MPFPNTNRPLPDIRRIIESLLVISAMAKLLEDAVRDHVKRFGPASLPFDQDDAPNMKLDDFANLAPSSANRADDLAREIQEARDASCSD